MFPVVSIFSRTVAVVQPVAFCTQPDLFVIQ